jgi:hypothetical protein
MGSSLFDRRVKVSTVTKTPVKNKAFTTPNANSTGSGDCKLCGNIAITQNHTPTTQSKLMSWDERRRTIRMINGILKNGMRIPLNKARV